MIVWGYDQWDFICRIIIKISDSRRFVNLDDSLISSSPNLALQVSSSMT